MNESLGAGNTERNPAAEADQTMAVIDWAAAPERHAWSPPQGWLLTFQDRALERAYLQFEYERGHKVIVSGLGVGVLLMLSFLWLDPIIAPAHSLAAIQSMRLYIGIPSTVLAVLGAIFIRDVRYWLPWISVLLILVGGRDIPILLAKNSAAFEYLSPSIWNIVVAAFFLCGLPLRWGMGVAATLMIIFAGSASATGVDSVAILNHFAVDSVIIFVLAAFATYRYERAARMRFVAQALSQIEATQRIAAESERRRWLEVLAAFLRHELKNAITGVSTSVELAGRSWPTAAATRYLARADRSVSYMRRLLTQVADATSLEAALRLRNFERVDFGELVRNRIDDFQHDHPDRTFTVDADNDVAVNGDADSLIQMLDKLIDNALEHGEPSRPIQVQLRGGELNCQLVVSNEGDSLPLDVEQIFEPFLSRKRRRAGGNGLGLGLFVARTIATHHRGTLRAEPPAHQVEGARFVVELPRASA